MLRQQYSELVAQVSEQATQISEQATQLREKDSTTAFALFQNGADYDIVRASIPALSDEEMQEIYQKVQAEKKL